MMMYLCRHLSGIGNSLNLGPCGNTIVCMCVWARGTGSNSQVSVASVAGVAKKAIAKRRSACPVNISLEVFGDRWSLLIVRDLMVRGFTTFQDFVESGEGIATNILANRLRRLRKSGIVTGEVDEADRRRVNYRLTEKGIDLAPVMVELLIWGAQHEETGAPPAVIAEMARNRRAVLEETRRRWQERDPTPILLWLGGTSRPGGRASRQAAKERFRQAAIGREEKSA
jgi:DNA-binding HxlR family transcriptional regulator